MMYSKRIPVVIILAALLTQCKSHHISTPKGSGEQKEAQMDGMEQAMFQEFMQTRDLQLNQIPTHRLEAAYAYMQSLQPGGSAARTTALAWQERGPNNVGGRTRALMVDKRDATGNTVFAGSVSGGLFKTTNFTNAIPTWTVINDFLPNLAITNIIQDKNTLTTMYASTGEGWFNFGAVRGAGIFKSSDGGTTWNQLVSTVDFEYVQDLVIDNNGNLYCALRNLASANRGVQRSTDGGLSWTEVLGLPLVGFDTGRASDLEVAANGDIYATLGVFTRGVVWKSTFATNGANTGAIGTWVEITPPHLAIYQRLKLSLAPSNSQRVYLLCQDSISFQIDSIYRSSNGGTTWQALLAPGALNNGAVSQTWYNIASAVDPNNADILVVAGFNIARSTDAGNNWSTLTNSASVHVDHHILLYNGSSKLLDGNDGGIYYSETADQPSPNFANKNNGYNVTQYYGCDLHPTLPNYFLAGAQDNGTQRFNQPGINSTTNATGGDGGFCHIDQTDGLVQITSNTGNRYNYSQNGGATFSASGIANNRGQFINPTDYDDNNNILYCGDDPGSYFFITGWGVTVPVGTVVNLPTIGSQEVTAVKVDPFGGNTVWLGVSFGSARVQIIKLTSANTVAPTVVSSTFLGTTTGASNTVNANISSIDVDPANANHIIATISNYGAVSVWESTNGGVTFSSIEGNLPDMPVHWALFAPANAQLNGSGGGNGGVLLATELGVWTTSLLNGFSTVWAPNNSGFANVSTQMLQFRLSDNTVAAATHGRGLFTAIIPTVVTGVGNNSITKNFIRYSSAGNGQLQIVIGNLQTKTMTVRLLDMSGRLVYSSQGRYQNTAIDINRLQSGVYIVKITGDKKENYQQQIVKR